MKALIIGGGAVSAKFHIPAAIELFGVDHVYVADPDEKQLSRLKVQFNIQNTIDDYHKWIKSVDFAILATPPHAHASILKDCINENLPVLCEKPATLTVSESNSVLDSNRTKNVTIGMCHLYRFFPNRIHIKKLIEDGDFGEVITVDIQEGFPASWPTVSGYNVRKELVPGGVLIDSGIHSIDFLLWCFGEPMEIEYYDDSIGGLESNARMNLAFKNNVRAKFRISRTCTLSNKILIYGSSAKVELDIYEMEKLKKPDGTIFKCPAHGSYDWTTIGNYQLKDFTEAIKNHRKPFCTIEEGIAVIKLVEHCYKLKAERPNSKIAPIPGLMF